MNTLAIKLYFHRSQPLFASTVAAYCCWNMQQFSKRVSAPVLYDCVGPGLYSFLWLRCELLCFGNISCEDACPVSSFIKLNGAWLESQTEQAVKSKQQKIRHTGSQGGFLLPSHKLFRKSRCHGFFGCTKSERQKRDREGNQHADVWVLLPILLINGDYC